MWIFDCVACWRPDPLVVRGSSILETEWKQSVLQEVHRPRVRSLPRPRQTLKLSYVTSQISRPSWCYITNAEKGQEMYTMAELLLTDLQKMPQTQAWAGPGGLFWGQMSPSLTQGQQAQQREVSALKTSGQVHLLLNSQEGNKRISFWKNQPTGEKRPSATESGAPPMKARQHFLRTVEPATP